MQPSFVTEADAREGALEVLEEAVDPPEVRIDEGAVRCDGVIAWKDALATLAGHECIEQTDPADPEVELWSVTARRPHHVVVMAFDREGTLCAAGLWDDGDL